MRTIFQFIVLVIGGLVMLSGCNSAEPSRVEQSASPTTAPTEVTQSRVEQSASPTTVPTQVIQSEVDTQQAEPMGTNNFIFYDSFATW